RNTQVSGHLPYAVILGVSVEDREKFAQRVRGLPFLEILLRTFDPLVNFGSIRSIGLIRHVSWLANTAPSSNFRVAASERQRTPVSTCYEGHGNFTTLWKIGQF